ncbi:MAG: Gldg family protein [Brevinema sp.]
MKKNIVILLSFFIGILLICLSFYVSFGSRSVLFRGALIFLLLVGSGGLYFVRSYINTSLRRGKQARVKLFESCAILFFGIALFSLVNSFDLSIDWTEQRLFQISSQTKNIIKNINNPLKITLFSYDDRNDQETRGIIQYAERLARRYQSLSKNIEFKIVDPIREKSLADKNGIQQNGTLLFEMNGQKEFILPTLLVEQAGENESSYKGESVFSAVIDKLIKNKTTKIYYLTGHGELQFDTTGSVGYDRFLDLLKNRRYEVEAINLDHYPDVPEDADLIIIADSQTKISPQVYQALEYYITNNGSIMYLVGQNTSQELNPLLFLSGFAYIPNIAIDPTLTAKNNSQFSIIPYLSPKSDITRLLSRNNLSLLFPSSSIVSSLTEKYLDKSYAYDIFPLARMSQNGFGETSFKAQLYKKDDKDITEITTLAIASIVARKNQIERQRRAVIIGSLDFFDNSRINYGGNSQFILNSIDFLLKNDLKTSIPPKNHNLTLAVANPSQLRMMLVLNLIWILLWSIGAITFLMIRQSKVKSDNS